MMHQARMLHYWLWLKLGSTSRVRLAGAVAALLLHCSASFAATYSLPSGIGSYPFADCVQDATTTTQYNCSSSITLSDLREISIVTGFSAVLADTLEITSDLTLAFASDTSFTADSDVTIVSSASGGTLTISVADGAISVGAGTNVYRTATTIAANLIATGTGTITTSTTSTVTGTISAVNGAVSVGDVVGSITVTGTGTITLSGTLSGGNVQSNSGAITVDSTGEVTGNISSTSGTITTVSGSTVTGDLTVSSSPGEVTLNSKLTGSVYVPTERASSTSTVGRVTLNSNGYVTCNVTGYETYFSASYDATSGSEKVGGVCTVSQCSTGNSGSCNTALTSPGSGVCAASTSCTSYSVDHYELALPVSNVSCAPSTVTLTACADSSSPCTNPQTNISGQTAALSTATSGASLAASSVSFGSGGTATTTLSYTSGSDGAAASVTLGSVSLAPSNTLQCCAGGSSCSAATSNTCSATFATTGLIVSDSASGSATTPSTQTAGTDSGTYYLRAVESSTGSSSCTAAISGTQTVSWAFQCNNPSTCQQSTGLSLGASTSTSLTTLQGASNAATSYTYTDVSLEFDSTGAAPFKFNYSDVGQVTLLAQKTLTATSTTSAATLSGSSGAFVVKPAGFVISYVVTLPSKGSNTQPSSATDNAFVRAGEVFGLIVTATTSTGATAKNFGNENTAEGVLLTPSLVLPSGGAVGYLSRSASGTTAVVDGAKFNNGAAYLTDLRWSEVGIISITPSIASSGSETTYLGTSDVSGDVNGSSSENIGRFYPYYFTTEATPACDSGSFTYSGQALGQLRITAKNALGATTTNFDGSTDDGFAKNVEISESSASGTGTMSSNTVESSEFVDGVADATPTFTFTNRATAATNITLRATDLTDGETSNSVPSGTTAVEASTAIRSGRLRLLNAYGSELLPLTVPIAAQYYNGTRWVTNTSDSCTQLTLPTAANGGLVFGTGNLGDTETSARFYSGGSYSTDAFTLASGVATLSFTAPGQGNDGYLDLQFLQSTDPSYLYYPWTSTDTAAAAKARARFGIYKSPLIMRRESY